MPRVTVRMTEAQREDVAGKAQRAGLSESDIIRRAVAEFEPEEVTMAPKPRNPAQAGPSGARRGNGREALRRAVRYMSDWPMMCGAWGERKAEELLLEKLDSPTQYVSLKKVAVGDPVVHRGELYVVISKSLPDVAGKKKGQAAFLDDDDEEGGPLCVLRLLRDRQVTVKVNPDKAKVALPTRLDTRLPPEMLDFTTLEEGAVSVLSRGPQTLRQLYPKVHARQGFDTAAQRISKGQISQLAAKLMLGLVTNGLAAYSDGDPMTSTWSLTERGREASKYVSPKETYYNG